MAIVSNKILKITAIQNSAATMITASTRLVAGSPRPARRNEPLHGIESLSWHGSMSENYLPVVVGAAVVGDHVLRLLFSDGTVGDIDFSAERWTGALAPLNDSAYFAEVTVDPEAGTVAWPDGIDLAPEPFMSRRKPVPW